MKKVFILGRDKVGWSIDSDRHHIKNFLNMNEDIKIVNNILAADIIYCVWYNILLSKRYNILIRLLKKFKNIKIIANVTNDILNHKILFNNINYHKLKRLVDVWISPSQKVYDYITKDGNKTYLIPFYVDVNIFKKIELDKEALCGFLDIKYKDIKDKYLIGSFQRDSEGKDLSIPKWQKNPGRLIEILKELPKDKILLIIAGPRRHWIRNRCDDLNIPYLFVGKKVSEDDILINNLSSREINVLYNLIDLYLVTSDSEGGPKAILESSLTKTLIYSTDVGFAKDMIHKDLIIVEDDIKIVKKITKNIKNNSLLNNVINNIYIRYNHNNVIKKLDSVVLLNKYKEVLDNV